MWILLLYTEWTDQVGLICLRRLIYHVYHVSIPAAAWVPTNRYCVRDDDDLFEFRRNHMSLQLHPFHVPGSSLQLWCDVSEEARPFIPRSHRRTVFNHFHNPSHTGVKATQRLLTRSVVWPRIRKTFAPGPSNVSLVRHQRLIVMWRLHCNHFLHQDVGFSRSMWIF